MCFFSKEIKYLDYVISAGDISTDPEKIIACVDSIKQKTFKKLSRILFLLP